jgi:hypothetical protein
LRFTTGGLAQLGAAYQRIAERVPADAMIGEVLTDREASELLRPDSST